MPRFVDFGGSNSSPGNTPNGWYSVNGQGYKAQAGIFYSWGNATPARKLVRFWSDTANWGYKGFQLEIYSTYYFLLAGEYRHTLMGWDGTDRADTISHTSAGSNNWSAPAWADTFNISGNVSGRDVEVTPTTTYRMIWGHAWCYGVGLNKSTTFQSDTRIHVFPGTTST